jgi:hypothetical protein
LQRVPDRGGDAVAVTPIIVSEEQVVRLIRIVRAGLAMHKFWSWNKEDDVYAHLSAWCDEEEKRLLAEGAITEPLMRPPSEFDRALERVTKLSPEEFDDALERIRNRKVTP